MAVSISSYIMSGILITRGDTTAAGKISQLGVSSARAGRFLMDVSASPFIFTGVPTALTRQEQLFGLLIDTGRAISHMSRLSAEAKQWSTNVIVGQGPNQTHQLVVADSLRSGVDGLIIELGLIEASFNQLLSERTFPLALLSLGHTDDMIHTKLALLRTVFGTINKLLLLYKEGGGFSGTQSYLVLFQNSMELRPTGGFVGSVGKLTMVDGLVADFTIFDVYELDGQLRGHVDPPDPIRTLLSQEHWYLRDSNWDPDFFESGQRAAWFYEKETGQSVDGVISVHRVRLFYPITTIGLPVTIFWGKPSTILSQIFSPVLPKKRIFWEALREVYLNDCRTRTSRRRLPLAVWSRALGDGTCSFILCETIFKRRSNNMDGQGNLKSNRRAEMLSMLKDVRISRLLLLIPIWQLTRQIFL